MHVYIKDMIVRGSELVVRMSGCRMGCKQVMVECMYGCVSNPGKAIHVREVIERMKSECLYQLRVEGSDFQQKEFAEKVRKHLDDPKG
jgi:hypothetical protein